MEFLFYCVAGEIDLYWRTRNETDRAGITSHFRKSEWAALQWPGGNGNRRQAFPGPALYRGLGAFAPCPKELLPGRRRGSATVVRIGQFRPECFARFLAKRARPSRQSIIEQCWPAHCPLLLVTCPDAANAPKLQTLASFPGVGPASHGGRSEPSPTRNEARQTSPRVHPRTLEHRRVIRRDRPP